jgi:allantoin racemase
MRLWHQGRVELEGMPAYRRLMEAHFRRVAEPGTTIDLHGMVPGTYPTDYPGADLRFAYVTYLHSLQVLNNVRRAEREGYDGVLLLNLPETVQEEAQSLVDIPVVGYAQAAMYTAAMLGRRFAILAMIEELIPLYESHIARCGMESKAWGVVPLGIDHRTVFASFEDPEPVVRHVQARVRELAGRGVDVVIPGEAPVSTVLAAGGLTRVDEVPVVDAVGATVKLGEAMVRLAQVCGLRTSRASYHRARPPASRLDELARFYRLEEFGPARAGGPGAG